jgi:hypothetical protein
MAKAHGANKSIGFGAGRNSYKPSQSPKAFLPSVTLPTKSAKLVEKTVHQPKTGSTRAVKQYQAVIDESSGRLLCPECDDTFEDVTELVTHLVHQTMDRGYRKSILSVA